MVLLYLPTQCSEVGAKSCKAINEMNRLLQLFYAEKVKPGDVSYALPTNYCSFYFFKLNFPFISLHVHFFLPKDVIRELRVILP